MLHPFHQVETLGQLEIFDSNLSVNSNLACSYCHDPASGYANGVSILSVFTGGSNPGSVPITIRGAYPDNRVAKRNPQAYVYAPYYPRQLREPHGWAGWLTGILMRLINDECNRLAVRELAITPADTLLELGFGQGHAVALMAKQARGTRLWR
jgi:Di-haem cytochrome c peroxidase